MGSAVIAAVVLTPSTARRAGKSDLERSIGDFLAKYPDDLPLEWRGRQRKRDHQVDPVANMAHLLANASVIYENTGCTRWICKGCGAESPRGIGYVTATVGPLPAPSPTCAGTHAAEAGR